MYTTYRFADLVIAYASMMATSGKITPDLRTAIEQRGGMDYFERMMQLRKTHPGEFKRIEAEVEELIASGVSDYFTASMIQSDLMDAKDLETFVTTIWHEQQAQASDQKISIDTIVKGLFGMAAGALASGLLWWGMLLLFNQAFLYITPVLYLVSYAMVRLFTKQSSRNLAVLGASLLGAGLGILIGSLLFAVL